MKAVPCLAPGCLQYRRTSDYCITHGIGWARTGVRPTAPGVLPRSPSRGVQRERVELFKAAHRQDPGWLLAHVQRLFDVHLGPPTRLPAAYEVASARARAQAARDNADYVKQRTRARSALDW